MLSNCMKINSKNNLLITITQFWFIYSKIKSKSDHDQSFKPLLKKKHENHTNIFIFFPFTTHSHFSEFFYWFFTRIKVCRWQTLIRVKNYAKLTVPILDLYKLYNQIFGSWYESFLLVLYRLYYNIVYIILFLTALFKNQC